VVGGVAACGARGYRVVPGPGDTARAESNIELPRTVYSAGEMSAMDGVKAYSLDFGYPTDS